MFMETGEIDSATISMVQGCTQSQCNSNFLFTLKQVEGRKGI